MHARIEEDVRQSVVGRDEESNDCNDEGLEHYFLNDNENCNVGEEDFERVNLFQTILNQIPPAIAADVALS
jgi:hypothetical protein